MKKSGGEAAGSGDGGISSSGSKRRRSDDNDDNDESKEVGKDDANNDTTNQQQEGKEGEVSLLQLGKKITVRTKTHDGGSSSRVQLGAEEDNTTTTDETTSNRMDAFAMYSDGTTRRTRVSTEQHISKFLNGNNYQDDQQDR